MKREAASSEQLAWEQTCSRAITSDVLWKLDVYRSALFLLELARTDTRSTLPGGPDKSVGIQLIQAAASVSANIGEGYGRPTRVDRLRFLGYSLGSVRECMTWYLAARDALPEATVEARLALIARIRALLLGLIRSTRTRNGSDSQFES